MRWSVTRFWGKLYVRILAERSPVPTWARRSRARAASCSAIILSSRRERSTSSARILFWSWLFWSWHWTTTFVGRWVMRTALSVVLTLWPPGPCERKTSIRRSFSSIFVDLLRRDRGGAPRSGGGRREDRREGPPDRRLPLAGTGRPERQHHRQRRAHHPPTHESRGPVPGPEESAPKQDQGARSPALAPARQDDRRTGSGPCPRAPGPGGHGRSLGQDSHVQLSAKPCHRSSHPLHRSQPLRAAGRHPRRSDQRLAPRG